MEFHKDDKQSIVDFLYKLNSFTEPNGDRYTQIGEEFNLSPILNGVYSSKNALSDVFSTVDTKKFNKAGFINKEKFASSVTSLSELLNYLYELNQLLADLDTKYKSKDLIDDSILKTLEKSPELQEEGSFTTYSELIKFNLTRVKKRI